MRGIASRAKVHEVDLNDFASVFAAIRDVRPDAVFHLAAHANVRASFTTPNAVLANNVIGTSNLLEAIRLAGVDPWVQVCSTSEVYGQVKPDEVPIHEDAPMRPARPRHTMCHGRASTSACRRRSSSPSPRRPRRS